MVSERPAAVAATVVRPSPASDPEDRLREQPAWPETGLQAQREQRSRETQHTAGCEALALLLRTQLAFQKRVHTKAQRQTQRHRKESALCLCVNFAPLCETYLSNPSGNKGCGVVPSKNQLAPTR